MTAKKLAVIDTKEITAVDIRCKCGSVLTMPVTTQKLSRNLSCANCEAALWMEGANIQQAVFFLIQGIRGVNENAKDLSITFTVAGRL
jgi:hypothetical protein